MFSIRGFIYQFSLKGVAALDLRRKLGLSDGTSIEISNSITAKTVVTEEFARKWFAKNEAEPWFVVDFQSIPNPSLAVDPKDRDRFILTIDDETVKKLFIASRQTKEQAKEKEVPVLHKDDVDIVELSQSVSGMRQELESIVSKYRMLYYSWLIVLIIAFVAIALRT